MAGFNVFGPVYIDGVPLKVSESFKPPPKISLPAKCEIGNPTEVLFLDYDFSLEERVVAWTEEREQRIKEKEKEEARRHNEAAEAESQRLLEESEDTNSASVEERSKMIEEEPQSEERLEPPGSTAMSGHIGSSNDTETINDSSVQYPSPGQAATVVNTQETSATQLVPVNQPVYVIGSTGILQPLPAVKPNEHLQTHIRHSSFDPTDFENELDPFDRLELKTLDDMKELDQVLQNVHISADTKDPVKNMAAEQKVNGSVLPAKDHPVANGYKTGAVLQEAKLNNSISSNRVGQSGSGTSMAVSSSKTVIGINTQSNMVSYKPMRYLNGTNIGSATTTSYTQQGVIAPTSNAYIQHQQNPPSTTGNMTSVQPPNSVSYNSVGNTVYGSVGGGHTVTPSTYTSTALASNQYSSEKPQVNQQTVGSSVHQQCVQNVPSQNATNQYEIWREFLQKNSSTGTNPLHGHSPYNGSNSTTVSTTARGVANGYVGIHQNSGVPSPSGSKSQANSRSNTPTPETPRLRSARSTPDLAALESYSPQKQQSTKTVKDTPTPPPPVLKPRVSSPATSCDNFVSKSESPHNASENSTGLQDPYRQFSRDEQRFVDSITNMGFKRVMVSKAVQRIGRDEKQILDFLCGLTRLKEKGFLEREAEDVLILLQNDHKKAQSFLALSKRFQEFGFDNGKRPEFVDVQHVMIQVPDCTSESLLLFDQRLLTANPNKQVPEKRKKDMYKKLVQGIIGKNVGQLFKKETRFKNLPPVLKASKVKLTPLLDQNDQDIGLCALFVPDLEQM